MITHGVKKLINRFCFNIVYEITSKSNWQTVW